MNKAGNKIYGKQQGQVLKRESGISYGNMVLIY
jgi:hypothetical protein